MNSLVSVILPTYNRAFLLSKTLDSILAQTYQNWECIVVDDWSTDDTFEVIEEYAEKDTRIKPFKRPEKLQKGANSCRNFGFTKAEGEYIIWFDSDDLMTPDHIERKLDRIQNGNPDFVVARTQNFQDNKMLEPYTYEKKEYGIKASDFILLKIHWYTYDVMVKRSIAEKISWNAKMRSWQDYNYFCKMLLLTQRGEYIDEILTHRRIHKNSIQSNLTKSDHYFTEELLENRILTYLDINKKLESSTRMELIYGIMNLCYELIRFNPKADKIGFAKQLVKKEFGKSSQYYFNLALLLKKNINKGYLFLEMAKRRL